jgi:hypothetical protein
VSDIEVKAGNTVTVEADDNVTVKVQKNEATVNVDTSAVLDVDPYEYALTSSGIYTGNVVGGIPVWLQNAIEEQLTIGGSSVVDIVADLAALTNTLEVGVNQNITNINTLNTNVSALETSVVSRLDGNDAAILDLDTTKVTATEALAISTEVISTTFGGNVDAYIGSIASTYADEVSAIGQSVETLVVRLNGVDASITTLDEISIYQSATIRSATEPTIITHPLLTNGDLWINTTDGVVKTWNGTSWDDTSNTNTEQAYTWSAESSKFITAPDGSVTGWSFGDGTNISSFFKVQADKFEVQGTAAGYTPIAVDTTTGKLKFTGDVRFEGLGIDGGSTFISGNNISTGVIYNTGGSAVSYTMKIDLDAGYIHIK